jgi:hypothetical protein
MMLTPGTLLAMTLGLKRRVRALYFTPTGQLAGKGFAGREFKHLTDAMGVRLLRPRPQRRVLPQRQPRQRARVD